MIDRRTLGNPLRWYFAAVLLGMVLSMQVESPVLKYSSHRLVQLVPALGLLLWTYRPQPRAFFQSPAIDGWYGLGLVGFTLTALLGGFLGPTPWVSLAFLGVTLLVFGMLPLLQPVWRRYRADSERMLALFAFSMIGIDVGLWLIAKAYGSNPYACVVMSLPENTFWFVPYLHMNPRWANQFAVLLVWSFVPLLRQLREGDISRRRTFWWVICVGVLLMGVAQILLTRGYGATLAITAAAVLMAALGLRTRGEVRRLWWTASLAVVITASVVLLVSWELGTGAFITGLPERNVLELTVGVEDENKRMHLLIRHLQGALSSPVWGKGIMAPLAKDGLRYPHNLWAGLLHWTGLVGVGFSLLMARGFVPALWRTLASLTLAAPLLAALFVYQVVDDIWVRPFGLAMLLPLLPGLLEGHGSEMRKPPGWLARLEFPQATYRFIALIGLLLAFLSFVYPDALHSGQPPLSGIQWRLCNLKIN